MVSLPARASVLLVAALSVALVGGVSAPAFATTSTGLKADLAAAGTTLITLDSDVTVADASIPVNATNVVLDLAGFDLTTGNITLAAGVRLEIRSSIAGGSLTATAVAASGQAGITTRDATLVITSGSVSGTGAVGVYGGAGIGSNGAASGFNNGTITINGGTVTATGAAGAAGIGGGQNTSGSNVTVNGGTVTAQGGTNGAGIGGGSAGPGGTGDSYDLFFYGGTVTATGGTNGAGIGGGNQRPMQRLTINGATVSATGGQDAAGVGSGAQSGTASDLMSFGTGAAITATPGARTIVAGLAPSAVGNGSNGSPSGFSLAGTLIANTLLFVYDSTTVATTGIIDGNAPLTGSGAITNNGAIRLTSVADAAVSPGGATITGNNYLVTFDTNAADAVPATIAPIRVYATSFTLGNRTLPTPTRPGYVFAGWRTAGNVAVTSTSSLTANTTVLAQWSVPAALPAMGSNPAAPLLAGLAALLLGSLLLVRRRAA